MRQDFWKGTAFAIGVAAMASTACGLAWADDIYTVTATGTIESGYDYGAFGDPFGTSLTGDNFSLYETFDATTSQVYVDWDSANLNPATASASMTVNGHSALIGGAAADNTLYVNDATHAYTNSDSSPLYSSVGVPGYYVQLQLYNREVSLPLTNSLSQSFADTLSGDASGIVYFVAVDGSYLYGKLATVTLNDIAAANAPEPGSLAILGAGLAGLGWLRRRRAAS